MAKVTRLGFLKKTSAGAVAVGTLSAAPAVAFAAGHAESAATHADGVAPTERFFVYVRNPADGEMVLMVGDREITHTDRELVARLWHAAQTRHGAPDRAAQSDVR